MKRTYLPWLALAAAGASAGLSLHGKALATSLFSSRPLDASRFAVLGKPVGNNDWNLLVLEQIAPAPRCWERRADGLIDPALNRFDFTGICSRYLDSNGYSLRIGDEDLATSYRLRLQQQGNSLQLMAMSPSQPTTLLVGRGQLNQRDRDGFVLINLDPGWQLQRRVYGRQTLSHVYFANPIPLAHLIAMASGSQPHSDSQPLSSPTANPTPPRLQPLSPAISSAATEQGPIALQVIPFRP
jgi:hypothetical protein